MTLPGLRKWFCAAHIGPFQNDDFLLSFHTRLFQKFGFMLSFFERQISPPAIL
jgi:hypothetical protein